MIRTKGYCNLNITPCFVKRPLTYFIQILVRAMLLTMAILGSSTIHAEGVTIPVPDQLLINTYLTSPYKEDKNAISFVNKTIDKPLLLLKTRFLNGITFISVNFLDRVSLNLSVFMKAVVMNGVIFNKVVNASWVIFNDQISLYNVRFKDTVSFFNCVFTQGEKFYHFIAEKEAIFQNSKFRNSVEFSHSSFMGDTSFYGAQFHGKTKFLMDDFSNGVDFSYAFFEKGVEFDDVTFQGLTRFSNATFHGNVMFNRSQVSGTLDLSYTNVNGGEIDLTQLERTNSTEPIKINVVGSAINKINFYYSDFELYFPDNVTDVDKLTVYKALLNNFQHRGYTSSYERLYPEYQQFNYLRKGQSFFNFIQKYWWNYGLNKEKIFQWVAFLLIFFTLINSFFFVPLVTKYCSVPFLNKTTKDYSVIANPVTRYIYYLPGAFILTIVLFFGGFLRMGITSKEFISKNILVNIYLMIIVSIGTVCMFYMFKYLLS
jgi:uncharacterized protein YjbI with pentapeptide repeats